MPIIIITGVIGLALTLYIGYTASISYRKLFSVSLMALFGGLLFESFRVGDHWRSVVGIFVCAYLFSFLAFLPGKHEVDYNFEEHIATWPYYFLFIYTLIFAIYHKDKVTAKLTEGTTLILSCALVYWSIDYGLLNYHNWFSYSLMAFGVIFTVFSLINGLTHLHLSRTVRLTLSIWSTIIMFVFAIDNIIRVYSNPEIESSQYISQGLFIGLQYFLLGVSAVYIMQNYMLLVAFLPSRNSNYISDLKENKKEHIDRFSDEQVSIGHSLFCLFYSGALYWLNYRYDLLPRHTMIWLVFLTFPLITKLPLLLNKRSNY
jgi:hypothetical protein